MKITYKSEYILIKYKICESTHAKCISHVTLQTESFTSDFLHSTRGLQSHVLLSSELITCETSKNALSNFFTNGVPYVLNMSNVQQNSLFLKLTSTSHSLALSWSLQSCQGAIEITVFHL